MKNIVRKLIESIVIVLSIVFISSCRTDYDPYGLVVSGDFIYATNYKCFQGKEGEISIVGLSEEGKQKEILIFPNYIDGHKVVAYGARYGYKSTGTIEILNAKKIYYCNLLIDKNYIFFVPIKYSISQCEIYVAGLGTKMDYSVDDFFSDHATNYIDLFILISGLITITNPPLTYYYNFKISTISYYIDETCYFVDHVVNDKVSVIPPVPYKEGYEFDGWYSDLSYTTKWDFNNIINPIVIDKSKDEYRDFQDDNIELEYEPFKVYAKWKEII